MVCFVGGYVPGIIYGKDNENNVLKRLIVVRDKDLRRELRERGTTFENTLFELSVVKLDGLDNKSCSSFVMKPGDDYQVIEKFVVVPRQTQLNPGKVTFSLQLSLSVDWLGYSCRILLHIVCGNFHLVHYNDYPIMFAT